MQRQLARTAFICSVFTLIIGWSLTDARSDAPPDHACRFYGMIGDDPDGAVLRDHLVTGDPSMLTLAASNRNGWGISYFTEELALAGLTRPMMLRGGPRADHEYDHRYRDAVDELIALEAYSALLHVRAASSGHAYVPDPHPFCRNDLCFAHNGTVNATTLTALLEGDTPGYLEKHPPDYQNPYIDSELYWLYILKVRAAGVERGGGQRSHRMADAVAQAILDIYDANAIQTAANCLIGGSDTLYALRFDRSDEARYKVRYKKTPGAWIIASEPVGNDTTGWEALPPKSLGIFTADAEEPEIITVFPPASAYLSLNKTIVDDDTIGLSFGNGDAALDAGETVELIVSLENEGGTAATNLTARLALVDSLGTIIDSTTTFPDLLPGEIGAQETPFVVAIDPEQTAYFGFSFEIIVTAGLGDGARDPMSWTRTFRLYGESPKFEFHSVTADDGTGGYLEPDEEADLHIWLSNHGGGMATAVVGSLACSSPHVEILTGVGTIDTLAMGEVDSLMPALRIAVLPTCPDPEILSFELAVRADWGIASDLSFEVPVGGFGDAMEQGSGPWTHTNGIPGYNDAWHLSSLENHTVGGNWSWKCGAPDSGATYPDLLDAISVPPAIPLAMHTELRFWHWIRAEIAYGSFGRAADGGIVEASINGGPWTQLYPELGYDFVIAATFPPGPFPPETPVFGGWYNWRQSVFHLDGYSGTAQFRFRFGSDGSNSGEGLYGWHIDDVQILGTSQASDAPIVQDLPLTPALLAGHPNPFHDRTVVQFDVVRGGDVELMIYDLEGRIIRDLVRGSRMPGRHRVIWDGRDGRGRPAPAGLYFYRLRSRADAFDDVQRVIRLR